MVLKLQINVLQTYWKISDFQRSITNVSDILIAMAYLA